jgi:hypothetical protein
LISFATLVRPNARRASATPRETARGDLFSLHAVGAASLSKRCACTPLSESPAPLSRVARAWPRAFSAAEKFAMSLSIDARQTQNFRGYLSILILVHKNLARVRA